MIIIRFTITFLAVLGLYYIFVYRQFNPHPSADTPLQTAMIYEGLDEYPYMCYLPKGYGTAGVLFPLIVYLHHTSHSLQSATHKALNHSPVLYAVEQMEFPFVVAAPMDPSGEWDIRKLTGFVRHIQQDFYVDSSRMYLTGFHEGATAAWMLAVFYPDWFAAIAPVAGTGDPKTARERLYDLPVWIFHGKQDTVVPALHSLLMVGALKESNPYLNFTIYADKEHAIWEEVYRNGELYDWFLEFERGTELEKKEG